MITYVNYRDQVFSSISIELKKKNRKKEREKRRKTTTTKETNSSH